MKRPLKLLFYLPAISIDHWLPIIGHHLYFDIPNSYAVVMGNGEWL